MNAPLNAILARSWAPARWRLLGARLQPLTLAHARLMTHLGLSPQPADYGELVLLTVLASTPAARLAKLCQTLQSGRQPWRLRLWGLRVALALRSMRWRHGDAAVVEYVAGALRHWSDYVAYWTVSPPWRCLGDPSRDAEMPGASDADQLWTWLAARQGYTPADADACPVCLAHALWCIAMESEGRGVIVASTPDTEAEADRLFAAAQAPDFHQRVVAAAAALGS